MKVIKSLPFGEALMVEVEDLRHELCIGQILRDEKGREFKVETIGLANLKERHHALPLLTGHTEIGTTLNIVG